MNKKSGNVWFHISALCLCLVSEYQSVFVRIHDDGSRPVDMLCQHGLRQVVQQVTLDGPFDRTGTELGIVTRIGQEVQGGIGQLQGHAVALQHLGDAVDLQAHHLFDLLLSERQEHDGLVDTVQELRTDGLLQHAEHLFFRR